MPERLHSNCFGVFGGGAHQFLELTCSLHKLIRVVGLQNDLFSATTGFCAPGSFGLTRSLGLLIQDDTLCQMMYYIHRVIGFGAPGFSG